jgi:hypothetical protein
MASDADGINREICFLVDHVEIARVLQDIESRHYTRGDNGRPIRACMTSKCTTMLQRRGA